MSTILQALFEHQADIIFFLLGLVIGVFYGLQGWHASVKEVHIKDSPRWKNFKWVIGGAAFTFFGDLRVALPNPDKGRLLLLYFLGVLIAACLIVIGTGAVIWIEFSYRRIFARESLPPAPFSPVFDYFWYGYSYYRTRYEAAIEGMRNDLLKARELQMQTYKAYVQAYIEQVANSIAAVEGYKANPSTVGRDSVARQILRSIKAVVIAYQEKGTNVKVNANYMVAIPRDELNPSEWSKVRFSFGDAKRYSHFLALRAYAEDTEVEDFLLPVEDRNDLQNAKLTLPGAPKAFVTCQNQFIGDTTEIKYPRGLPNDITAGMATYFEGKGFKSFVSLNIFQGGGRRLGVVNVDSSKPEVFGSSEDQREEIMLLLSPFCLLLGQILES